MTTGDLVAQLRARGLTVASAESLTGGLVCAELTTVPGASAVVRGSVVAYATDVKASVLGVDAGLLQDGGAVQEAVAAQMAEGVCRVLAADVGLATTGVAGPDAQDGQPVGTVYVAVALPGQGPARTEVRRLALGGTRTEIRAASVAAVLQLAHEALRRVKNPGHRAVETGVPAQEMPRHHAG